MLDDVCRTAHAVDNDSADVKFLEKLRSTHGEHKQLQVWIYVCVGNM